MYPRSMYVLSKNKKNIIIFLLKSTVFTVVKITVCLCNDSYFICKENVPISSSINLSPPCNLTLRTHFY